jgi:hypothetical protein
MKDAAIAPGLMAGPAILLFKDCDPDAGLRLENRPSYRQPYDSATDNYTIKFFHV